MGAGGFLFQPYPQAEKEARLAYRPLKERQSQVVFACLNKMILLHKEEFDALGKESFLFNIHPLGRLMRWRRWQNGWIMRGGYFICDTAEPRRYRRHFKGSSNVICAGVSAEEPDRPLAF